MNGLRYIFGAVCLMLSGCITPQEAMPPLKTSHEEALIALREGGDMDLSKIWPLGEEGTYLQQLSSQVGSGDSFSLTVHVSLKKDRLEMLAFNDIAGRLYQIVVTPDRFTWEPSSQLPEQLRPDDILTDFFFSHLSKEQLESMDSSLQVQETTPTERTILKGGKVIRRIIRKHQISPLMWESITITQPVGQYKIQIKSVKAK